MSWRTTWVGTSPACAVSGSEAGGVAVGEGGAFRVGVLRGAVQGLEEDRSRWTADCGHALDQPVDQLVGELANEVAFQ